MKVVLQRVKNANVQTEGNILGEINTGILVLCGFEDEDTIKDIEWITKKIINLRIFDDENSIMNKSLIDINGEILIISQFTLHASTKKGNRPSYIKAAKPSKSEPLYDEFLTYIGENFSGKIQKGIFGANMQISLINDGPVTIIIDSKNKM